MQVSIIIIGQGLCGTWLSYYLKKAGISFVVIDKPQNQSASKIASGIINPVTGRRLVKTWMIDEVMPFAVDAYKNFKTPNTNAINEDAINGTSAIRACNVMDFFSAPDVEIAFNKRLAEGAAYLTAVNDKETWRQYFNFDFGAGQIEPCYLADVNGLLAVWRKYLKEENMLVKASFNEDDLVATGDGIRYENIEAEQIIYCDGIAAAQSKYFSRLPFAANKGEALIAEIPDLPATHIFKKGMSLVPWKQGQYWIGSTYQWKFENELPTAIFREQATSWLQSFCKMPFTIVDHFAALRPATIERRPFVGFHPVQKKVGIFNGMGTKGVSLAPYFAHQFAMHLSAQTQLQQDVDIRRFEKILSR
jgi:glycine/D-amino acid oxidase-like deaminating enzyme